MKTMFTCKDCPYYWKGEEDKFPCCHHEGPWEAPCEEEDYEPEEEDYETPDCDDEQQ